jgi:hypothetical protein
MKCEVVSPLKVKTPNGELQLEPGQVINLPSDKAIEPICFGKVKPIEKVAYRIQSKLLGCDIWLVESEESMSRLVTKGVKEPIYTYREIEGLKQEAKETIKTINDIKTLFPGSIIVR